MNTTHQTLRDDGWEEYRGILEHYCTTFYKMFPTKTPCRYNGDKKGIWVCLSVAPKTGAEGEFTYSIDIRGQLADGSWIKFEQWSLPKDIKDVLKVIPRMLALWEAANL